ncbi:MAG: hydroxyacylglutathione hydrolase [Sedimentisphaerales bacterium]|nr:hydroxyacylglutathione hydrolase [Sedimentisphaerales bacterium]
MSDVIAIPALGDNFIYLHRCDDKRAFVVDPGEAAAVLAALAKHGLTLAAILLTHHHWDHVGGAKELKSRTGCDIIGAGRRLLSTPDRTVGDGGAFSLGDIRINVIATPGHTEACVCYHVESASEGRGGVVYTGDTLFVGGCGRPMECEPAVMWESLCKLAALPDETRVCCGHDYTLENYEFALTIDPDNEAFQERLAELQKAVEYGQLTVPSTIAQEKATNIFLLAGSPRIKAALGMSDAEPAEVFAELRRRKNRFG